MPVEIRRMWPGGPLRKWSVNREAGVRIPYASGGFVGGYVCDVNQHDVNGVYRMSDGSWLCADHRALHRKQSSTVFVTPRGIALDAPLTPRQALGGGNPPSRGNDAQITLFPNRGEKPDE